MVYLKINDTLYPAELRERTQDRDWNDRSSMAVTVSMSHGEAASLFVDDAVWGHVYQDEESGDTEEYDDSDFSVAGSITDHRDGTVTVKMGKLLGDEALAIILGEG